jgi:serine/threonine protein kinase
VAIKKLHSPDKTEFIKEVTILKALGPKKHPHLINLLATFKHGQKYHLIFPYADANLRNYWSDRPSPSFDEETVLWSLKQMSGIASALWCIHNFKATIPVDAGDPSEVRGQKILRKSAGEGKELFGRHGDIKPENILWFKKTSEVNDEMGVLQIADFGLGKFHRRGSRSKSRPSTVISSPTYLPPECKLHKPVSRAYDIWSLGCLYLEFITWLLKGSAAIDGFSDSRGKEGSNEINEDNFFTIANDRTEAVVREEVLDWVDKLHQHDKCSALIHDLLNLIMEKLLVVESKERICARELNEQLKKYVQKAECNKAYLLDPAPRARTPGIADRPKSASPFFGPSTKTNPTKKNVTFSEKEFVIPGKIQSWPLSSVGHRARTRSPLAKSFESCSPEHE